MGRKRFLLPGWWIPLSLLTFATGPALSMDTVRVAGTGASLGLMRVLGEEFSRQRPDIKVSVVANLGSGGAVAAVKERAIDLGVSTRPLRPGDREQGLRAMDFASTPFVIAVHREVEVPGLSLKQLAATFQSEQAQWPDGTPVRVILRPERDFDTWALRGMSEEMNRAVTDAQGRRGLTVAVTDQDSADALEKVPGSLGVSSLALILTEQRKIKPLAIEGVAPSVETLKSGAYPHSKPLILVTGPAPSTATSAFVEFLRSPAVRTLLPHYGVLPAFPAP